MREQGNIARVANRRPVDEGSSAGGETPLDLGAENPGTKVRVILPSSCCIPRVIVDISQAGSIIRAELRTFAPSHGVHGRLCACDIS